VSLADAGESEEREVDGLACPLFVRMRMLPSAVAEDFVCTGLDGASYADESTAGLVLVRVEEDESTGGRIAVCATTHLSDFTAVVRRDLPTVNRVDPLGDAGLLRNYLSPENLFPVLVLGVLLGAFIFAWITSAIVEGYRQPELRKLRQAHMLRFGQIKRSYGMEKLHIEDQLDVYLRVL